MDIMDFTISTYRNIVSSLIDENYSFVLMRDFITGRLWNRPGKHAVLRHDIDRCLGCAYRLAQLEKDMGVRSTYYVRYLDGVYVPEVLESIEAMGHEVGYHYECMDKAGGDPKKAFEVFRTELKEMRKHLYIATACMHGYPLTPWRNTDLWKYYDYREEGIVGEPYLDIDYTKVEYFTDTGMTWDSRYKVKDRPEGALPREGIKTSMQLVSFIKKYSPKNIIILAHPDKWHDNIFRLVISRVVHMAKNPVKRVLYLLRSR